MALQRWMSGGRRVSPAGEARGTVVRMTLAKPLVGVQSRVAISLAITACTSIADGVLQRLKTWRMHFAR